MTYSDLKTFLAFRDFEINTERRGAGKFYDLEVGCGRSWEELNKLKDELGKVDIPCKIETVLNREHEQFGSLYLEISSFWIE